MSKNIQPQWLYRQGELAGTPWESIVDGDTPGWQHTGLHIADLTAESAVTLDAGDVERVIVPLAGQFDVAYTFGDEAERVQLQGRKSVFSGPTDVLYLGAGTDVTIYGRGRIAVASSPTTEIKPTQYLAAADTPIELRGAGKSSRQVHNFGTPGALDAARLIVCEVITPAGNWSSYPPHKHDVAVEGEETALEEIYYFEAAPTVGISAPEDSGFGIFSAYSSPAGELDVNGMVRSGDIALVPYGYHGPAVAAPEFDLYYLNVMAGPGAERAWLISDDPQYAWIRDTWEQQEIDPRLPFTGER